MQSATIRANRIPSAFAENVDSSNNSHACADDGSGVFGRELQPGGAEQEGQAAPGGRFRKSVERVVEDIRHALAAVSKPVRLLFTNSIYVTAIVLNARAARCRAALPPLAEAPGGN